MRTFPRSSLCFHSFCEFSDRDYSWKEMISIFKISARLSENFRLYSITNISLWTIFIWMLLLVCFSHVTKEFSHSMVMWTTQKKCVFMEQCCHLDFSYWLRVKKSGEIMADDAAESGRYYPVNNNLKYPKYDDFVIWSDATETNPKW